MFGIQKEFYSNQIEFNLPWTKPRCDILRGMCWMFTRNKDWNLFVAAKMPWFVGTHVHLVLENEKWLVDKKLSHKKLLMFNYLTQEYIRSFSEIINWMIKAKLPSNDLKVMCNVINLEYIRLINNHNILIYFDYKFFDKQLEKIKRSMTQLKYYYTNWANTPKYQPIVWSEPTSWKPLTLEVRWIPNMFALNYKWMQDVISRLENLLNAPAIDSELVKENILDNRKTLIGQYKLFTKEFSRFFADGDILVTDYIEVLNKVLKKPLTFPKKRTTKAVTTTVQQVQQSDVSSVFDRAFETLNRLQWHAADTIYIDDPLNILDIDHSDNSAIAQAEADAWDWSISANG